MPQYAPFMGGRNLLKNVIRFSGCFLSSISSKPFTIPLHWCTSSLKLWPYRSHTHTSTHSSYLHVMASFCVSSSIYLYTSHSRPKIYKLSLFNWDLIQVHNKICHKIGLDTSYHLRIYTSASPPWQCTKMHKYNSQKFIQGCTIQQN